MPINPEQTHSAEPKLTGQPSQKTTKEPMETGNQAIAALVQKRARGFRQVSTATQPPPSMILERAIIFDRMMAETTRAASSSIEPRAYGNCVTKIVALFVEGRVPGAAATWLVG